MKFTMSFAIILLTSVVIGCSTPKQNNPIHYGGGERYNKWIDTKLKQCKLETASITIAMYEANRELTDSDLRNINKFLMDSCVRHYRLDV